MEEPRRARIRASPDDFRVEELALYPPSGEGAHTFVSVEKTLRTSEQVLRDLARAAGVSPREVGCAGQKDRQAVTRQWFSVPGLDPVAAMQLELRNARVIEAHRHIHKLRTGHLRGNRFEIWVRNLDASAALAARATLDRISLSGMPNRFGAQRFGLRGDNADRGREVLRGGRVKGDHKAIRFALSALQAEVFNRVLETRPLALDQLEIGDVARVEASGGLFLVEDVAAENLRAASYEISPTGPIFGNKTLLPEGAVAAREALAMQELSIPSFDSAKLPRGIRLAGARRPVRVRPLETSLAWHPEAGHPKAGAAKLNFDLPSGSYATVLLEVLFGAFDEGRPPADRAERDLEPAAQPAAECE